MTTDLLRFPTLDPAHPLNVYPSHLWSGADNANPEGKEYELGEDPLGPENFEDPRLNVRPRYVAECRRERSIGWWITKGCAGLAHEYRISATEAKVAMETGVFDERATIAIVWANSAMREDDLAALHCVSGFTMSEIARAARELPYRPWGAWVNQWGRNPGRTLPCLDTTTVNLESPDELVGIDIRSPAPGDPRFIDYRAYRYFKDESPMFAIRHDRLG